MPLITGRGTVCVLPRPRPPALLSRVRQPGSHYMSFTYRIAHIQRCSPPLAPQLGVPSAATGLALPTQQDSSTRRALLLLLLV